MLHLGLMTKPFLDRPLVEVMHFARSIGVSALEVVASPGSRHLDPHNIDADALRHQLDQHGLSISVLAYYEGEILDAASTLKVQTHAKAVIDAAALLGVPTVCMLPGFPPPGMSKLETIGRLLPQAFEPVLQHAEKRGVRIAFENFHKSCLQTLDHFDAFFHAFPQAHAGLNFDPSHLVHQHLDHLAPIRHYPSRIFHTHAKDTLINPALPTGWRYVLPGEGAIHWPEFIAQLQAAGFHGTLSIEHEDSAYTAEEGCTRAAQFLMQYR